MTGDVVIGIDSSTSATKAIAWDREGRDLAEGRAAISMTSPAEGCREQNAEDWWTSTATAIAEVLTEIEPERIAAVAISNQRETFGFFAADGTAVRPATVWLDERAKREVDEFSEAFGADRLHAITGKPPDITPCIYRFAWFRQHEPDNWSAFDKIADVNAYLTFRLTGEWATPAASADPMGIVDMASMTWSGEVLDALDLDEARLPRLVRSGSAMAEVSRRAADETGLPVGTPVVAGGGDGQAAGSGANVLREGYAYANLGTAVVSGAYGTQYAHDRAFRTMGAVAEQGYIYETCLRSGTFLVDWVVRTLFQIDPEEQTDIFEQLEREAAAAPIGSRGIAVVPYWSGVMTPYWDTRARGIIAGLTAFHDRGDIYRAVLEGIALEQALGTNQVEAATRSAITHYVAIGGGAASDLWCSILADASGRAVQRSTTIEASSLGAGMAAAVGAGWYPTMADAASAMAGPVVDAFEPDAQRRERYGELLAVYRELWPAVAPWNGSMVRFAEAP